MSSNPTIAPYGTWTSPISSELVSGSIISLEEVHVNPATGAIFLVENRPSENGRCCIVEQRGSESIDILPAPYSARSKIHEYGGGACTLCPDGSFIFTDSTTNGVFRATFHDIQPVVQAVDIRFADFCVNQCDSRWILAVQEDHRGPIVENSIVVINAEAKVIHPLVQGADFYTHPRFSPDGTRICWLQWNHPYMPWEGTELYVADWKDGEAVSATCIAGQAGLESICQPRWNTNGILYFMSDRTGFWQLYTFAPASTKVEAIVLAGFEDADLAMKEGRLGNYTYAPLTHDKVIIICTSKAKCGIVMANIATKECKVLPLGLVDTALNGLRRVSDNQFVVIGTTETVPTALYLVDVTNSSEKVLLKSSASFELPPSIYSIGEHISFPRTHSKDVRLEGVAHAIFTPPRNPYHEAPAGTKPPLIVSLHGGPNAHAGHGLSVTTQYWTSRGFAWVDVNYAGSTGYGRAYRESLKGLWGLADTADAASCVAFLAAQSWIDPSRVGIVGPSAGGYTVLQSLIHYPDVWAGGVSRYGIGNLKAIMNTTHKFESHYGFGLVFPKDATEAEQEAVFTTRSPCYHTEKIKSAVLLLQGSEDKVVPMAQAEEMYAIMKERGLDTKLVVFPGEGHGWKMKIHIRQSIEEEEAWWKKTLVRAM